MSLYWNQSRIKEDSDDSEIVARSVRVMPIAMNIARYILGFCLGGLFMLWFYSLNAHMAAEDLGLVNDPQNLEILRLSDVMRGSALTLVLGVIISGVFIIWGRFRGRHAP